MKKKKRHFCHTDERGATLIELLTAIFLLSLALVSALAFATINFKNESIGASRLVASNLAREGIELARNIRDTNWIGGEEAWDYGLQEGCSVIPYSLASLTLATSCPSSLFQSEDFRVYKNRTTHRLYQSSLGGAEEDVTPFFRKIEIMPICFDGQNAMKFGAAECPSTVERIGKKIMVDVRWKQSGIEYNVTMTEQLFNWR